MIMEEHSFMILIYLRNFKSKYEDVLNLMFYIHDRASLGLFC